MGVRMNEQEERRNWLIQLMNYYGRYHNHKETMAWVATVFYITGVISAAIASRNLLGEQYKHYTLQTTSCISVAAVLAMCLVQWQFSKRRVAADNALKIYKKLTSEYNTNGIVKVDEKPEGYVSEVISCLGIVGATAVAIIIVRLGIF